MKKAVKHNGNISIWKFLFAILILLHHCVYIKGNELGKLFNAGSIGVEFFFLTSGYLLAKKVYSEDKSRRKQNLPADTFHFIFNKIKGFYPYLLFSFLSFVVTAILFRNLSLSRYFRGIIDLTLIQQAGLPDGNMIGGVWYLSALVLSMLLVYPIMKKYKKTFSCLIAPIIAIFLGGYLIHLVNPKYSLRTYNSWTGIMYMGLGRAFFEVSLGTTVYELAEKLKKINFTKLGSILLSFIEVSFFIFVILANSLGTSRKFDWLYILLLFVAIMIAFSEKTYFYEKCNNKFFYYLEKLSLPIYLNNFLFINIINDTSLHVCLSFPMKFFIVIFSTILFSMIEIPIVSFLTKFLSNLCKKIKKYFIVESK